MVVEGGTVDRVPGDDSCFEAVVTIARLPAGPRSRLWQRRDHWWGVRFLMATVVFTLGASACGGTNAPARELAEERFAIADVEEVNGAVRVERQVSDGAINAVTNTGARIVQIYQVDESATAESVVDELQALAEADGWEVEEIDRPGVLEWESAVRIEDERTRNETRYRLRASVDSGGSEVTISLQHLR